MQQKQYHGLLQVPSSNSSKQSNTSTAILSLNTTSTRAEPNQQNPNKADELYIHRGRLQDCSKWYDLHWKTSSNWIFIPVLQPSGGPPTISSNPRCVLNIHKAWDMVTVVGKITQLKQPTTVGSPRKRLHLVEATFTDSTGSIPLELWEDHIAILKSGQCYKMTSVQVKVWCNRKKVTATQKTIITETSNESLYLFNMTQKIRLPMLQSKKWSAYGTLKNSLYVTYVLRK